MASLRVKNSDFGQDKQEPRSTFDLNGAGGGKGFILYAKAVPNATEFVVEREGHTNSVLHVQADLQGDRV